MMTPATWKARILTALDELSDIQYQRDVWCGEHPAGRTSTFAEAVNRLYNDYDVAGYVAAVQTDSVRREHLAETLAQLESSIDAIDERQPAASIVLSVQGSTLREAAARVSDLIRRL